MPSLSSLAKVAFAATCMLGLATAEPNVFQQQEVLANFGEKAWSEAQTTVHTATDKLKDMFNNAVEGFTVFNHPAFSEYRIRYKNPSLCDPDVKQVMTMFSLVM